MILCRSAAIHRETMTFPSEWTWNTETWRSLQADKTNWDSDCDCDCQVSKLSPFDCLWLLLLLFYTVAICIYVLQYNYRLESRWSTTISPPQVQRSCRGMTEKPAASGRRGWDPPGRRVETICTSQWLFLISSVPPGGFVQLPWSFYGPCGHNLPKRSPEGKSFFFVQTFICKNFRLRFFFFFSWGNNIYQPVRLYRAGFPQKAVLAGTAGRAFFSQSWFSFWLHMLRCSIDRP